MSSDGQRFLSSPDEKMITSPEIKDKQFQSFHEGDERLPGQEWQERFKALYFFARELCERFVQGITMC
ncbi:MAG: hypothetical protein KAS66_09210 [Candidatus Omnitrophica bacterium]|nr:hypothetical protein [Candidatus Omnitrophota bacterium]